MNEAISRKHEFVNVSAAAPTFARQEAAWLRAFAVPEGQVHRTWCDARFWDQVAHEVGVMEEQVRRASVARTRAREAA